MEEVWKDIEGYEGLYQISNLGNVKSLRYQGRDEAKVLTPKCNNMGRLWVELRKHGEARQYLIHRLVAFAFIPNPEDYPQINHIDENPKNNIVDNLEWCTGEYNIRAYLSNHPERKRKQWSDTPKYNCHMGKKVHQLSKDGEFVRAWANPIEVVNANGWNEWSIIQCCKGARKTAYGYIWRFAN